MKKKIEVKTLYGPYIAVLEPEPDMGGYMITVPKRPDVISWGKNLTHAKKMAKEAVELSVEAQVLIVAEKEGESSFASSMHWHELAANSCCSRGSSTIAQGRIQDQ